MNIIPRSRMRIKEKMNDPENRSDGGIAKNLDGNKPWTGYALTFLRY